MVIKFNGIFVLLVDKGMKKILSILFVAFLGSVAFAQRSDNSLPYSFQNPSVKSIGQLTIDRPEAQIQLIKSVESFDKVYDFGVALPVTLNLLEEGSSEYLVDGRIIVRHIIHAEGAYGINLNFKKFQPGKSGKLWIYPADKSSHIGGFDYRSVTPGIPFATAPVKGESIVMEFIYDPAEKEVAVELADVVYEFADFFEMTRAFGNSGACNKNVNCPEYADKAQEKRSVAMILTQNNVRWCSGALINNTLQDGKPYFLTARHCNTTANSIFMFNYESPNCNNIDGPTNQTLQGCTIHVNWAPSDVTLVELSSVPPVDYFTYFSGWNISNTPSESVYGIHHPKGDIKKISFDTNTVVGASYVMGDTALNHWKILNWEVGTTESGSSGSPLFNQNAQIVGQLHGGQAHCANSVNDYYGKFAYSWFGENTPETALKFWLDPNNTGQTQLDGAEFNIPDYFYDLSVIGLAGPDSVYCLSTIDWVATVRNSGVFTIQDIRVRLFMDGAEVASKDITAAGLTFGSTLSVTFENIPIDIGVHEFEATVEILHQPADEHEADNSYTRLVNHIVGDDAIVTFKYDLFSSETKWGIYSMDGSTIYQAPPAAPHTLVEKAFCLPIGCYMFRVTDSGLDGICCGNSGNGYFGITDSDGDVLIANEDFTERYEKKFCVPGLPTDWESLFEIYPNPAQSQINVKVQSYAEGFDSELIIFSVDGKVLVNQQGTLKYLNTFDVSEWAKGIYFVRLRVGKLKSVQKFIKN